MLQPMALQTVDTTEPTTIKTCVKAIAYRTEETKPSRESF